MVEAEKSAEENPRAAEARSLEPRAWSPKPAAPLVRRVVVARERTDDLEQRRA